MCGNPSLTVGARIGGETGFRSPTFPMRTWILFEAENVAVHLPADVRIELADVPFGGGSDFNAVGQDSVPKFPHKVTE
jgi:hypothetical protein